MVKISAETQLGERVSALEQELVVVQESIAKMGTQTNSIPGIQEDLAVVKEQNTYTQDSLRRLEEMMYRQFGQDWRNENGHFLVGGERGRGDYKGKKLELPVFKGDNLLVGYLELNAISPLME